MKLKIGQKVTVKAATLMDAALQGFTLADLANSVMSNEKVRDEKAVWRVFNDMVKSNVEDAKYDVGKRMKNILAAIASSSASVSVLSRTNAKTCKKLSDLPQGAVVEVKAS
jgi:hypothetical protein